MSFWKQAVLVLAIALAGFVAWALWIPSAGPVLARWGLDGVLARFGVEHAAAPQQGGWGAPSAAMVRAEPARAVPLTDRVAAIGSARPVRAVALAPEVSGQIADLPVASGQHVAAGTVIVRLESAAQQIAADRAALMLEDARATAERLRRLRATGAATDLQAQEAELGLRAAELSLREAEFALSQRQVVAPISGWVGILSVEPGDLVSAGTELTTIDDRSSLIVDFRVPERVVGRLAVGDGVQASPLARAGQGLPARVSAIDNRVDEASRTLRVQAALANADDSLRPGMAFAIAIDLPADSYPAVDPLAIQWSGDGSFVWLVREGKAAQLPVRIVQRNADAVLIEADLAPGDLVVTEGVQALRPGAPVTVAPENGAAAGLTQAAVPASRG
ncbi:efflux RND transporter periplasmic adaptor subunit [Ruixingdingia sedimenti]|uniref:Efflux RND transporter periplasmic adaptor subunit n=1 Tax=Ruixingdingia sedimenti TaxID=3073604 RepID=A0ABU1F3P1_9RHOB|nr:efflux RND transporter periplasmic adaptor subunit [Xinfangfangia sp. LG-4]MDR5651477.1 efflux RND transporter periplasmic adaptor subunit [Xinfangfangia sp. LG-4]